MKKVSVMLAGFLVVLFCLWASGGKQYAQLSGPQLPVVAPSASLRADADFGKTPLQFIPNQGQMDRQVVYYVQGRDKAIFFTPEGLTFALAGQTRRDGKMRPRPGESESREPAQRWSVKLDFVNSNPDATPVGLEKSGAVVSYFKGKPEEWKTGLPAWSKIVYRDLWPGIDLLFYGTFNRMKYEFIVHPGADPSRIKLAYRGAEKVERTAEGRLEVETPIGGFEDDFPVAYQDHEGKRLSVPVVSVLEDIPEDQSSVVSKPLQVTDVGPESRTYVIGFEVGRYDKSQVLVLDPAILIYCGYIGGSWGDPQALDYGNGIAIDNSGNAYVTGGTVSVDFPVFVGPYLTKGGSADAFVAKVDSSGETLVYCGYIGGFAADWGTGIAVNSSGNAYVVGTTESVDFPIVIGPGPFLDVAHTDAFVAKVNTSGTALDYCGCIGMYVGDDEGKAIAIDTSGSAYITGWTWNPKYATPFPVTGGWPDPDFNGGNNDAFVAKVKADGTAFEYSGYFGGSGDDEGMGIAVDGYGNVYVTGKTTSSNLPVAGELDPSYNGGTDAFVVKVNALGTSFEYCGYIGGSGDDEGHGIGVDGSANAYITGSTGSDEDTFPVLAGPDLEYNLGFDAFVAKVNASGTVLVYCGYIGGSAGDEGNGIAVSGSGNAFITGSTGSTEDTFPKMEGPDLTYNLNTDAFVAMVNTSGTALVYCGYIGGSGEDNGHGIAIDSLGNAYIIGRTTSTESTFPVIEGPDLTYNGDTDAFVAKISAMGGAENTPPVAQDQTVLTNENTSVLITLTATDSEDDPLTFPVLTGPQHGTLTGDPPSLTYTPNTNYYGPDSFTFKANDGKADSNVATVSITVKRVFAFYGFEKPIDNKPVVNAAKAGSSIPVKWRITDLDGTPISDPASFKSLTSYNVSCGAIEGGSADEVEEYSAGSSGLQYFGDGNWQFNWKTPKGYAGKCQVMVLNLADGSKQTAYFKFK